jgi:hypothetical protein
MFIYTLKNGHMGKLFIQDVSKNAWNNFKSDFPRRKYEKDLCQYYVRKYLVLEVAQRRGDS